MGDFNATHNSNKKLGGNITWITLIVMTLITCALRQTWKTLIIMEISLLGAIEAIRIGGFVISRIMPLLMMFGLVLSLCKCLLW